MENFYICIVVLEIDIIIIFDTVLGLYIFCTETLMKDFVVARTYVQTDDRYRPVFRICRLETCWARAYEI